MPYIKEESRKQIERAGFDPANVDKLAALGEVLCTPGELNYVITKVCLGYLGLGGGPHYAEFNEVIGVLECVKQELYRRAVAPYEDLKIQENGDVYDAG